MDLFHDIRGATYMISDAISRCAIGQSVHPFSFLIQIRSGIVSDYLSNVNNTCRNINDVNHIMSTMSTMPKLQKCQECNASGSLFGHFLQFYE